MGCLTEFIAKIILTAFNIGVSVTAVAVMTLSALVQTYVGNYGSDVLSKDADTVLIGLETVSALVICLGVLGMLVSCCCHNKLFLYSYLALGSCLVIAVLTFAIMGQANLDKYSNQAKDNMISYYKTYNFSGTATDDPANAEMDTIFNENRCCGVSGYEDYHDKTLSDQINELPLGCCIDYTPDMKSCTAPTLVNPSAAGPWPTGCFESMQEDVSQVADATAAMGIVFGLLLLALLGSTVFCVKCTDALPI